ncbi:tripartite tricarboxylate transporter substrate-binding protein [Azohydromonas lata]|uniref:Tripartite tricarboxylate transporter substrate-binding protein n=1 Tax=Azohydromonas lata TaxID=45677 RepID=A0ABU5INH0_9BURK|nr:tripartite tricarboxylate transporter substrate-binding protein [Azohydromonas lata]MDZ5460426.1 tripartite tricarboxylate transporter substrate-binding protein [Azohydromonas lata]
MNGTHSSASRIRRRRLLATALALPAAGLARAQAAWPTKPITLIVPFAPGGIADITARTVAQAMSKSLGQTLVIDNRPSAGSIVGTQAVAKAAPDGYTVLLMSNSNAVSEGLFRKLPFNVTRDLAPVGTLGFFDLAAFVDAGSRFKRLAEVIAYAKANPGKLTIGTISIGSTQHLAAELFKTSAGMDAVIVPYKSSAAVLSALRGGEIDVGFEILGPFLSQVSGGTLRTLAVTSDQRFPTLADVPTVQEAGVRGYSVASWNALAVPAATPAAVVARLNQAANEALSTPAVQQQLQKLGVRAQGGTPQALQSLLASEIKRWAQVMADAKIERQ